ncbi:hypothetical protein [Aureliella helgolandensis]|uniref:GHMP kinase C-terminal domain-containing protein n=1 Tax=Aureliella helgolandensis TaxID=2527968 RepID=A0A518G8X5_9BACT|nr:hypothetical protein [Aureliella helgolandensis]QDV25048.1 hypothetical protein Q31a_33700 [Aureliella helgolandensis]
MLEIQTGCRIHFGLMELCPAAPLRFAGLGLGVAQPGNHLRFSSPACVEHRPQSPSQNRAKRDSAKRLRPILERWLAGNHNGCPVPSIELVSGLPAHAGLGSGTQLGVAAAFGLWLWQKTQTQGSLPMGEGWQPVSQVAGVLGLQELAERSGRGLRSAIGLQCFLSGGLVLDRGESASQSKGEARSRGFDCQTINLPESWRVLLIQPMSNRRVFGDSEAKLLARIGRTPNPDRNRMLSIAEEMLESFQAGAFAFGKFISLLDRYMDLASKMFHEVQGGKFNGPEVASAVLQAQRAGLQGVGQSSWGPTIFGFAESKPAAEEIAQRVRESTSEPWKIDVVAPSRHGARWRWSDS